MLLRTCKSALTFIALAGVLGLAQTAPKKVTQQEAMASLKTRVPPEYPALGKQLKIQGEVELEALIGETGLVEQVNILKGNPMLTRSASEAVKKWKFSPFQDEGKPCKVLAPLNLTFKL